MAESSVKGSALRGFGGRKTEGSNPDSGSNLTFSFAVYRSDSSGVKNQCGGCSRPA